MGAGFSLGVRQVLALVSLVLFHLLSFGLIAVLVGTPIVVITQAGWGVGQVKLLALSGSAPLRVKTARLG